MIDRETGAISLDAGLVVAPGLTRATFAEAGNSSSWHPSIATGEWSSFRRNVVCGGQRWSVTLYFEGPRLDYVQLFLWLSGEQEGGSWDDWTYEAEMERKRLQEAGLAAWLGGTAPYQFGWGEVRSIYDDRAACSLVLVRYRWEGAGCTPPPG